MATRQLKTYKFRATDFQEPAKKFTFLVKNKSLNNVKTVSMVSMVKQEILSSSNEKPTDHGTNSDIHLN